MSREEEKNPGNLPEPYRVGYKRPPVEHRFRKGQSGNPAGRPKGAKNVVVKGQGLDFGSQPANQMLLEEAYRMVTVREGDKLIELPAIKAVFRAMGVSAMKGNRLAQVAMAELVRGIEEDDRQLRSEHFGAACEYKRDWEDAIKLAEERGLPAPQPLPHPDDVIIDVRRAEVRYAGPMTPEEKRRWDRMLEFRDEQQDEISYFAKAYREHAKSKKPRPERLESLARTWEFGTKLYDKMNNPLPERYRKPLKDRFRESELSLQPKGKGK